MNTGSIYQDIIEKERSKEDKRLIVLFFARPSNSRILKEFEYLHYSSGKFCTIYNIGYAKNIREVHLVNRMHYHYEKTYVRIDGEDWYFSARAFNEFKELLQRKTSWGYSGEVEMIVLQSNPKNEDPLDFNGAVAVKISKCLYEGYMISFISFMETFLSLPEIRMSNQDNLCIADIVKKAIYKCHGSIPIQPQPGFFEIIRNR